MVGLVVRLQAGQTVLVPLDLQIQGYPCILKAAGGQRLPDGNEAKRLAPLTGQIVVSPPMPIALFVL